MTLSIVWFKRDLRLEDHTPLVQAASRGAVACLYVYEPEVLGAAEHDAAHLAFVNECLHELRSGLRAAGSDLLLRRGRMPDVLEELRGALPFTHLFSHEETGLAATYARDRRVAAWCRKCGVAWTEIAQHGVFRPLETRDGWAARWRARMNESPMPAPTQLEAPPAKVWRDVPRGEVLDAESLGLPDSTMTEVQGGGASAGRDLLDSFLHERGESYQQAMSTPVEGWDACSRLSTHFAYGSVSIRTAFHATAERREALKSDPKPGGWRRSLASFDKRLRWHCHFIQKLEDEPAIEHHNFNRALDGIRTEDPSDWSDEERRRFEAYRDGRTGYPFVDACLRCLATTGWINFRMRAMLVSFASYHLWLHWKPTAVLLAQRFLDFEPGIHYSQCQMQSGTTGINTVRIYSPYKQATDQDPQGVFVRRWVPELADVPLEHLVSPQAMPALTQKMSSCRIGVDYPEPIVDHATEYRAARARMYAARRTAEARDEATKVYEKHGSRRRPQARRTAKR